jgi:tetratricopeptide (TPR) repeat protein
MRARRIRTPTRTALRNALPGAVALALLGLALAAPAAESEERRGWGPKHEIDERTGERLQEARELLLDERYGEAAKVIDSIRIRGSNPLERAKTYQLRAFVEYGRQDNDAAREYFEKAVAEGTFSDEEKAEIRYQIAQLFLADQRWKDAIAHLERWFGMVEKPNSAAFYLLALCHYQLSDLDAALSPAQKAVDLTEKPQESWLQLLLALRLTRKEYEESVPLLEALVRHYPKKTYWVNLSTVHGALGNYAEALIPLQLAYEQGLLTEDAELRRLAQLLLYLELPYRAAEVLAEGLAKGVVERDAAAYEMLANSWIASKEYERAVGPLTRAAELAEDGSLFVRLAQVQIQREQWDTAAEALGRALEKGGLESPGDAQLLMGIAFYSQKQPQQAASWFARARQHSETREEASRWLEYLEREMASGVGPAPESSPQSG